MKWRQGKDLSGGARVWRHALRGRDPQFAESFPRMPIASLSNLREHHVVLTHGGIATCGSRDSAARASGLRCNSVATPMAALARYRWARSRAWLIVWLMLLASARQYATGGLGRGGLGPPRLPRHLVILVALLHIGFQLV